MFKDIISTSVLPTSDGMGSARQLSLGRFSYSYPVQTLPVLQTSREAHGGSQTGSQQAAETTRELFISRIPHPASRKLTSFVFQCWKTSENV